MKDEIEKKNREKRKEELKYEKKYLEQMKEEFNETDGGGMDELDFELQVFIVNFYGRS